MCLNGSFVVETLMLITLAQEIKKKKNKNKTCTTLKHVLIMFVFNNW